MKCKSLLSEPACYKTKEKMMSQKQGPNEQTNNIHLFYDSVEYTKGGVRPNTHCNNIIQFISIDRYGVYLFTECSIEGGDVFLVSYINFFMSIFPIKNHSM